MIRLLLLLFFLTSCATGAYSQRGADNHQQMLYTDYINSYSKTKILVRTNILVREIVDGVYPDRKNFSGYGFEYLMMDGMTIKNYYSENQESYEHAIVEAFEYCKRDNPSNYQTICELAMVGNFNATNYEKNYAKGVFNSNLYQITILNIGFKRTSVQSTTPGLVNCRNFDQKMYSNANTHSTSKKSFVWTDCKANIRINLDEILELYSRPETWADKVI